MKLSGREPLAGVRREIKTRCRTGEDGKVSRPWGGKISGREALAGVRREIKTRCRTGEDGKVKLGGREALAVT